MAGMGSTLVENDLNDSEELQKMIIQKAQQLFAVCDKEQKGFASKRDMQRLQTELPLSPEQLEDVFDSLDHDGNGFLTLEEFTDGFGMFLGLPGPEPSGPTENRGSEVTTPEHVYENEHVDEVEDEEHFGALMDDLGAYGVLDEVISEDVVKGLWSNMRRDKPEMLEHFEKFLGRVCGEIKRTQTDYRSLESALRNKTLGHDEEMRRLYDEMEQQIRHEKERVLSEEKVKERQMREELEREITEKDRQLQETLQRQREMEDRLSELNTQESEIKTENEKLYKEREMLEEQLHKSQESLDESRSYINQLRNQQRTEKRERARSALQISEGIALERETLVKQLDVLRDMNKKLRDDRDIFDSKKGSLAQEMNEALNGERAPVLTPQNSQSGSANPTSTTTNDGSGGGGGGGGSIDGSGGIDGVDGVPRSDGRSRSIDHASSHTAGELSSIPEGEMGTVSIQQVQQASTENGPSSVSEKRNQFQKQGSLLSNYFGESKSSMGKHSLDEEDGIEYDEYIEYVPITQHPNYRSINPEQIAESYMIQNTLSAASSGHLSGQYGGVTGQEDGSNTCSDNETVDGYGVRDRRIRKDGQQDGTYSSQNHLGSNRTGSAAAGVGVDEFNPSTSSRMQPLGANASIDQVEDSIPPTPERFFKVVFVGDSGVGKSSFIYRYCSDTFKATFSATIGVDFQVKTLEVDGHWVALQLWDTAGQERFRSITKQYFRKADGVLIMYDVTSEASFTNVRNWMTSVQEGTEEGTVLVLVGNKTDLCEDDEERVVKTKDGAQLADEYGSLFYEVSAKSGINIKETISGMASLLQEKEDTALEKTLTLGTETTKKKGCCGK